jgi:hypothetical protein
MRRGWWCGAALVAFLAWPAVGAAQQGGDRVELEAVGKKMSVIKPRGWVAGKPPRGSVALFQAAGDASSQIEIKATPGLQAEQHKSYSATFHASLIKAGFKRSARQAPALVNKALPVSQTFVYEVNSDGRDYAMVVWEANAQDITWQIVAFFPVEAWDAIMVPLTVAVGGLKPSA